MIRETPKRRETNPLRRQVKNRGCCRKPTIFIVACRPGDSPKHLTTLPSSSHFTDYKIKVGQWAAGNNREGPIFTAPNGRDVYWILVLSSLKKTHLTQNNIDQNHSCILGLNHIVTASSKPFSWGRKNCVTRGRTSKRYITLVTWDCNVRQWIFGNFSPPDFFQKFWPFSTPRSNSSKLLDPVNFPFVQNLFRISDGIYHKMWLCRNKIITQKLSGLTDLCNEYVRTKLWVLWDVAGFSRPANPVGQHCVNSRLQWRRQCCRSKLNGSKIIRRGNLGSSTTREQLRGYVSIRL